MTDLELIDVKIKLCLARAEAARNYSYPSPDIILKWEKYAEELEEQKARFVVTNIIKADKLFLKKLRIKWKNSLFEYLLY